MSFVGGDFTSDIFISYSHGDVRGVGDSKFKQWSASFWDELRLEFEAHEDLEGLTIFFDSGDRPGDSVDPFAKLDPLLEARASNAAVFIPLISPRYLKSDYCMRELRWWRDGQGKAGFDMRGRIAPLIIWGTPPNGVLDWPEALKTVDLDNVMGMNFFSRENVLMNPQPFGWPGGGRINDKQFSARLLELVGRLRLRLIEFKEEIRTIAPPKIEMAGPKPSIYLHGREDSRERWEQAWGALSDAGYPVTPFDPEPVETDPAKRDTIREKRIETMSACDALMVIGPEDNSLYSEELMILGKADRGQAIDRAEKQGFSGKRLPCAVVDAVADDGKAIRRRAYAQNNRLGWFKQNDPTWVNLATDWLGNAMQ